ncbi:carboxymuconolactone decarboxylase family protein [Streptomyces sp. NPDC040724]|uniref:carboxymuconolactone decarboxylase family protein n=1 Tax=unclassified Streptomyces TaxID=2593676 RepID=UPI0033FE0166
MPRISYPDPARLPADVIAAIDGRPLPNVTRAMLNSPHLALAVAQQGMTQFTALALPDDLRELVVLAVGYRNACDYVIAHHEPLARALGCTDLQLGSLRRGETPGEVFTSSQRQAIELAWRTVDPEAVRTGGPADPGTGFSDRELVEIVITAGYYQMICGFCAVVEVELESDADSGTLAESIRANAPRT